MVLCGCGHDASIAYATIGGNQRAANQAVQTLFLYPAHKYAPSDFSFLILILGGPFFCELRCVLRQRKSAGARPALFLENIMVLGCWGEGAVIPCACTLGEGRVDTSYSFNFQLHRKLPLSPVPHKYRQILPVRHLLLGSILFMQISGS